MSLLGRHEGGGRQAGDAAARSTAVSVGDPGARAQPAPGPSQQTAGGQAPLGSAQPTASVPTAVAGVEGGGERKKTMRELWEEDQERERNAPRPVLEMGGSRMCETGGCGYFSDDGK
mmetsp:Transcript_34528/g.67584  ORF Transcript_34528/g.67584 Transcript_34528/m.67584 type:complete len:117 (+) Transcript_34528:208-558(+)|eukprot:CAMPEP_0173380284 /NCGR_PEP_ID=MMETSP1356-20130122/2998_1 /TAXON_ID=77927 ORGANISM="Hemiselmis virescens, Strain PCC157" /NCGR_SAMPLE_ID=MMETSP1356 /ASSEMBLY_ACC=CAM_ASM_000847 /LENGTH=116 /DNA_ID=CAMNT_0014333821 /DNA_START=191 /DNA_END=541 /DNA_ORIENTATION=-